VNVKRAVAGLTAVVTAVLGLSLVTAGPAAAATGVWRAYGNTNPITSSPSTWRCGVTTPLDTNVSAQPCAIRASGGLAVQVAVIVRNSRSSLYAVEAAVELWDYTANEIRGRWVCARSGVGAHSWSVCFGTTVPYEYPVVVGAAGANGTQLGRSLWV
jgi:hypothetical protein